jgi:hypothetical protein
MQGGEAVVNSENASSTSTATGHGAVAATGWYCYRHGNKFGPLSLEELVVEAQSTRLRPTDLVWHAGLPRWVTAATLPFLFVSEWYYLAGQQRIGPLSVDQLRDAARLGRLTAQTPVWTSGFGSWTPCSEVPGLLPDPLPEALLPPLPLGTLMDTGTLLFRLQAFVGNKWPAHYRRAFERILADEARGNNAGWSWNWAAALFGFWFVYRRLYASFAAFFGLFILIGFLDKTFSPGHQGGALGAALYIGQAFLQGYLGDRLYLKKARRLVAAPGVGDDPAILERMGRPNALGIWLPVGLLALFIVYLVSL